MKTTTLIQQYKELSKQTVECLEKTYNKLEIGEELTKQINKIHFESSIKTKAIIDKLVKLRDLSGEEFELIENLREISLPLQKTEYIFEDSECIFQQLEALLNIN